MRGLPGRRAVRLLLLSCGILGGAAGAVGAVLLLAGLFTQRLSATFRGA